jgi:hypothetical protein
MLRPRFTALLATLAAVLALAPPAGAGGHVGMQAGAYVPFQGDVGHSLALQMLGSNHTGKSRWGGEFEYRRFDTQVIGVRNVDVESYVIRALWQYHFLPDAALTPYLGLGLGVTINDVDDDKVDRVKGRNTRNATGAGPDGLFLLGLDAKIPGADFMSLYAEGRVGFSYDFTGREDKTRLETENLGGVTASGGLRFRF